MIKNNILKIIILIYITVFFIIGYGHFLRYNNYLTGGDSRHVDKNYTEFLIGKYKFENDISDDYYRSLYKRLLKFIENNPKHPLCIKQRRTKYKYDYFIVDTLEKRKNLASKILSKEKPGRWGEWEHIDEITIKIFINKNNIYILFSHCFYDGLTIIDLFNKIFMNLDEKSKQKIQSNYIPVISEYSIIDTLLKTFMMSKRNLRVIKWKDRLESRNLNLGIKTSLIKKIKNINNCNYSIALFSLLIKNIFLSIKKNNLNLALLVALNKKETFFNNYGVICFSINRSDDINDICIKIREKIKKNSGFIYSSYFAVNLLGLKTSFYDNIDCVLSSMISSKNEVYIEGSNKRVMNELFNPYCTAPIYISCMSFGDSQNICITMQTPDIDKNKLLDSFKKMKNKGEVDYYGYGEEQLKLK
jgi:hypothetical protein